MEPVFFADPSEFRAWLEENHARETELLVGFWKKGSGRASITWPESVDEALCFGWIDGVRRGLGDESYTIRFTPRKSGSIWSKRNVERVAVLVEEGRMLPAGLSAFEARSEAKTGIYGHERERPAEFTAEQEREFRVNAAAWEFFESQPPGYRRIAVHWVVSAKREETRARRLARLIEDSAVGVRVGPLRR